jgi:SAM-dependent methyltransferase
VKRSILILAVALVGCASAPEKHEGHHAKHGEHGEHHADKSFSPGEHHGKHHSFEDAEMWAKRFDNPERDAWQKPDDVVAMLELKPTDIVADIGAGTGYFVARIAPKVPEGKVLGVDIEPKMVEYLTARAEKDGQTNVVGVVAAMDDPKLPEPVDVILVVNTYHHIEGRTAYFQKQLDKLKDGARVVIVDFKKGELPFGPPPEMKLAPEKVIEELEAAGLKLTTREEEKLPHQYVLVFSKA